MGGVKIRVTTHSFLSLVLLIRVRCLPISPGWCNIDIRRFTRALRTLSMCSSLGGFILTGALVFGRLVSFAVRRKFTLFIVGNWNVFVALKWCNRGWLKNHQVHQWHCDRNWHVDRHNEMSVHSSYLLSLPLGHNRLKVLDGFWGGSRGGSVESPKVKRKYF